MAHHDTRFAQLPVGNVNTFHTSLFHHNIWGTFSRNVKNVLGMFMNCLISQRVIFMIPSGAHHHLALFSHYAVLFLPSFTISQVFCVSPPSAFLLDGWMHKRQSYLFLKCQCFAPIFSLQSGLLLCFVGTVLRNEFGGKCSTGKYIRNIFWQFDMSNFSLTSINITVGINWIRDLPHDCVFLQPTKWESWELD